MLNLQKNDVLDLSKREPSLKNITVAAGWDVAKKGFFSFKMDYDLDLSAMLLDENGKLIDFKSIIYFGNMNGPGIRLHGDNLTGEGDGDDEKISISLDKLPSNCAKIVFSVVIYDAQKRRQSFDKVNNAYVRILNEDKGSSEICRFNLSENGLDNTAIIFGELIKSNDNWSFKAVGQLLKASIKSLAQMYQQ